MEHPRNNRNMTGLEAIGAAVTIIAGIVTILSLGEKTFIITGIVSAIVLGIIAISAFRHGDRTVGAGLAIATVAIALVTVFYSLFIHEPAPPKEGLGQKTTTSQAPPTHPDSSTPVPLPSPDEATPIFEGSAAIKGGESIDLEVASPHGGPATHLAAPADIFIEPLALVFDRQGYLITYMGSVNKGKEECRKLLDSGTRSPMAALPNVGYCAITSEGRIALVRFSASETISRVGSIRYYVWDR